MQVVGVVMPARARWRCSTCALADRSPLRAEVVCGIGFHLVCAKPDGRVHLLGHPRAASRRAHAFDTCTYTVWEIERRCIVRFLAGRTCRRSCAPVVDKANVLETPRPGVKRPQRTVAGSPMAVDFMFVGQRRHADYPPAGLFRF